MKKLAQTFTLTILCLALFTCKQKTELSDLDFEQKVFYQLFPKLSGKLCSESRLITPPPPPRPALSKKRFNAEIDCHKTLQDSIKSEDYRNRLKKRDSIIRNTLEFYIAFPDSINQFERKDIYKLLNHFGDQKPVISYEKHELEDGFKVDFTKLKSDNRKLKFKPLSEFPGRSEFWTTQYDFNFCGLLSFSRILFDKTKSFGVMNASFLKGRLSGDGYLIFIKKDQNGIWKVDKIQETWVA